MAMIKCPNCGKEFDSPANFCDNCGTKLNQIPAENENTQPVQTQEEATVITEENQEAPVAVSEEKATETPVTQVNTPVTPIPMYQQPHVKKKKLSKKVIIAIIVAVALVIVSLGVAVIIWNLERNKTYANYGYNYYEDSEEPETDYESNYDDYGDDDYDDSNNNDYYSDAKGAGSYYIKDGDEYALEVGEKIEFEVSLKDAADALGISETDLKNGTYTTVWTVSGHLKQSGGYARQALTCSGTARLPGDGYIMVTVGYMDENWKYDSVQIKANVKVLGDVNDYVSSDSGSYNSGSYDSGYDSGYNGGSYGNNYPTRDYKCSYCDGKGTISCTHCLGKGTVTVDAPNYSGGYKPPQYADCAYCTNGRADCPLCP